jgi:hypothetical protein
MYKEPTFSYIEIPNMNGNVMLSGYFQSEKYLPSDKSILVNLVSSNAIINDYVTNEYNKITEFFESHDHLVCVHVRRGDYLLLEDYHTNLKLDYYTKGMEAIATDLQTDVNNLRLIIFSNDIPWCKENMTVLTTNKIYFVDIESEEKELGTAYEFLLMTKMTHYIIANSTFSWWGSYLNTNTYPQKICVAPKQWFGPKSPQNWEDIYYADIKYKL